MTKRLTENQFEVLWQLDDTEYRKPMDFGAWNGSHHSITANRLIKKGFVQRRGYIAHTRRVNKYRRTPAGKDAYDAERELRNEEGR